jgi:hypothetical protein
MKQNFFKLGVIWCLVIAVVTVVPLFLIGSPPAAAQSADDYFQISYEPFSFSKTEIYDDEVFFTTVQARATCIKDLPLSVSEAKITGRVIAEHKVSGTWVMLNSCYSINIKPFPDRAGETAEINKVIYLQFPDRSESGNYSVMGITDKVEIPFLFGWIDVRNYLPQDLDQTMGTLKYISADKYLTPTVTPIPTATSTPTPESGIGTGTWVGIWVAIISLIALILGIWLIKRRGK